jgi:tetratricopeptide (TPR) repeat protein
VRALTKLILPGLALAALAGVAAAPISASAQDGASRPLAQANADLQAGEADQALALLSTLAQPGGPAEAFNLKCRVELTLEDWDRAAGDCEQAVRLDGENSDNHLWLGRALGEKASRASFLSAYSLGKRVRIEFEEAVRLNPRNGPALADLGEFDYSAPGFMGGGVDKAAEVAAQLDKVDPVRAHELRSKIAEQGKDYGTAERELKQALAASAHPASEWMTLASFYARRGRWPEMETALRNGENSAKRDKRAGAALYDGASVLIRAKRDPNQAARMLEYYLASGAKTEQAPAFVAYTMLARLEQQQGDAAKADRDRAAALAMAHEYKPAQALKH